MTTTTTALLTLVSLAAVASFAGEPSCPASVDASLIVNYRVVKPGLAVSGKISETGLAQLKALGFKTILNLRTEQEGAKAEEAAVKAQGLRYEWVPVTPASLSLDDVAKVGRVLDDPTAAPILFHCASANRVGAVWAILQVQRGKTLEAALEEGRTIGLGHPELVEAVKRLSAAPPAK
jgi:uncharacterized protein (TIGR01244 family)